jgi:hypothetical protein
MSTTFKVGDRVKAKISFFYGGKQYYNKDYGLDNATGTVKSISLDKHLTIKWDKKYLLPENWIPERFEKISKDEGVKCRVRNLK